jgi:hypothetical protein
MAIIIVGLHEKSVCLLQEFSLKFEIEEIKRDIQNNCDISDAKFGSRFSLCGLLLRMRDLYKWENNLVPWEEPEPADLLEWIESKEDEWEKLLHRDFNPIRIGDEHFDPFDVTSINIRLFGTGLIYGAGFASRMKPSFFLGQVEESNSFGDLRIDVVSRELVRDLFMSPAMRQGNQIFARRSAMLFFIWDLLLEMKASAKEALYFALSHYGLDALEVRRSPTSYAKQLHDISNAELDAWIFHEIGEAREEVFAGGQWRDLVSTYPDSPIEFFARLIKDLLADTHPEGLLMHIANNRLESSMGFYIAFMSPFMRIIFPDIQKAFRRLLEAGDWTAIELARSRGFKLAHRNACSLIAIHEEGRLRGHDWAREEIISKLIQPTGALGI